MLFSDNIGYRSLLDDCDAVSMAQSFHEFTVENEFSGLFVHYD